MSDNLGAHVTGPALELAARIKRALDEVETVVSTEYGDFYVARVELRYGDGDVREIVGYLTPDEGLGKTFDFWTPEKFDVEKIG